VEKRAEVCHRPKTILIPLRKHVLKSGRDVRIQNPKPPPPPLPSTGGLPVGLKFDDIKKTVRRKKADFGKSWTTQEEIAYQALCREISFQQNPNKDKDMGNPL
jgi:hypothetical protein